MLLVHHQQAQVRHRGKHRRAHAHREAHPAAAQRLPVAASLALLEAAVQHRHLRPEAAAKAAHQLRGEGNFRHQHQRPLPGGEGVLCGTQVHLRLPASRHPLKQKGPEAARVQRADEGLDRQLLPLGEVLRPALGEAGAEGGLGTGCLQADEAPRHQAPNGLPRFGHGVGQLAQLHASADGEEVGQRRRLRGRAGQRGRGGGLGGHRRLHHLLGNGTVLHGAGEARRECRPQGLSQGVAVVGRGKRNEAEDVRGERRLGLQHLGNGFEDGARGGLRPAEVEAERAAPAKGHEEPLSRKLRRLLARWQGVGEGPGDRPANGYQRAGACVRHGRKSLGATPDCRHAPRATRPLGDCLGSGPGRTAPWGRPRLKTISPGQWRGCRPALW